MAPRKPQQPKVLTGPASPAQGNSVMTAPLEPGAIVADPINPGATVAGGVPVITSSELTIEPK